MISLVRQRMLHPTIGYQMVRTLLTSQQIGMDKFLNNREVNVRVNKGAYLRSSRVIGRGVDCADGDSDGDRFTNWRFKWRFKWRFATYASVWTNLN